VACAVRGPDARTTAFMRPKRVLFPSVRDAWVAFFEKGGVASALRPVGGSEGAIRYSSAMLAAPPAVLVRAVQVVWQRPSVLVALTVCLACVPFGDGG